MGWCEQNHLLLNTKKKLVVDFCPTAQAHTAVHVQSLDIETVDLFKSLSLVIKSLSFLQEGVLGKIMFLQIDLFYGNIKKYVYLTSISCFSFISFFFLVFSKELQLE